MSLRPYNHRDAAALEAFLRKHVATSMFSLFNLFSGGRPTVSWVVDGPGGIAGFLGQADNGNLMPQWPGGDWGCAKPLLAQKPIAGLVGPADQCRDLMAALGLLDLPMMTSQIQPGLSLLLVDLRLPEGEGFRLTVVQPKDKELLTTWRTGANMDVLDLDADRARTRAQDEVPVMIAKASHYLLWHGQRPVSMAGVNAAIPRAVQVGAVYTPPDLRRQGFARRAVAMMLAELRSKGVQSACLFAANHKAVMAYLAIGFQPSHSFGFHLFAKPEVPSCR